MFRRYKLADKSARKIYYQCLYRNYANDYKKVQTSDDLLCNVLTLMLNPNYVGRPTAESLLTLISIKLQNFRKFPKNRASRKRVSTYSVFDEQFDRLAARLSIKLHPEILRLSKQIATGFSKIQSINSDNYLVTILWIASKIVLIRPYEPETLGLSKPCILDIERKICNISRFKLCII